MSEAKLQRAYDDVMAEFGIPEPADDEWSTPMFAEAKGISYNQACSIIAKAARAKRVKEVGDRKMPNGHTATCYRWVSPLES